MNPLLVELSLAFGLLNVLISALVVGNRFIIRNRDRRHAAALDRLRPELIDWIGGDAHTVRPPANAAERAALVELLAKYGRSLTGDGRRRVTELADDLDLVQDLLDQTRSLRAWKRAAAAFRLGDLGDRQPGRLVALLDDRDRRVRNAAARSLGKQGAVEGVAPIVLALSEGRVARAVGGQALLEIGPAAADSLVGLMRSTASEVRAVAAELLGRLGTMEQARMLAEYLHDPAPEVRVAVVRALGRLGGRIASAALPAMLDDPIPFVRAAAATAISAVGSGDDLSTLLGMVADPEHLPAHAAAMAIAEMAPEVARSRAGSSDNPYLDEAVDLLEVHG